MEKKELMNFCRSISTLNPVNFAYFDALFNHRTILFNTDIDECFYEMVVYPLLCFEQDESDAPVRLVLNTPGGSVADSLSLLPVLDQYKKKLVIEVPNYCCSMGTILLAGGGKNPNVHKRAYPFSYALFHSGMAYFEGEFSSVEDTMQHNKELDDQIRDYIINNTNVTREMWDEHYRKQWFLSTTEMKELGLIQEIVGVDTPPEWLK